MSNLGNIGNMNLSQDELREIVNLKLADPLFRMRHNIPELPLFPTQLRDFQDIILAEHYGIQTYL